MPTDAFQAKIELDIIVFQRLPIMVQSVCTTIDHQKQLPCNHYFFCKKKNCFNLSTNYYIFKIVHPWSELTAVGVLI